MNSSEMAALDHWDERELEELVARFVRTFHRLPSLADLDAFHRSRISLRLRLPAQTRVRLARFIAA